MKKIVTVVGARPQFVKATVVSKALQAKAGIQEILVHTGQHYDTNMSQIFFSELDIPQVDYQLNVGSGSQAKQTADMLVAIEEVLVKEKPDWLLIYGDTNSTLAGALAAAKLHIPIAHVEAGLRSYNRKMPEEVNRLVADQLASVLFAPTQQAIANLKKEGYVDARMVLVGDVMYDAALLFAEKAKSHSQALQTYACEPQKYILATIHRAENTDTLQKLFNIFSALDQMSREVPVLMPLHPRTKKAIATHFPELLAKTKIQLIEPIGFLDMVMLEKNAALIVTDSGGVQKEAFFYQVPCITLRDETEWVETVHYGWNNLVQTNDVQTIYQAAFNKLGQQGQTGVYPYGNGHAANLIAQYLMKENVCVFG